MTSSVWHAQDGDFVPGAELFRSDREFSLWAYSATHGQLLFRSERMPKGEARLPTTVDVLFKPVDAMRIQAVYHGLVIRCATEEEAARIRAGIADYGWRADDARVLMLESEGTTGYVMTRAVGWREGKLSRLEPSFFNTVSPYPPEWPLTPLAGVGDGSRTASPQQVAEAFLTGLPDGERRDRYRSVYLVWAVTDTDGRPRRHNLGVFLTEADAEEAKRLVEPHVAKCFVEPVPMVL